MVLCTAEDKAWQLIIINELCRPGNKKVPGSNPRGDKSHDD